MVATLAIAVIYGAEITARLDEIEESMQGLTPPHDYDFPCQDRPQQNTPSLSQFRQGNYVR
jgi:hypothetical protein